MSGDPGDLNILDLGRMIKQQASQTVGKVYLTFGETISLKDYLR